MAVHFSKKATFQYLPIQDGCLLSTIMLGYLLSVPPTFLMSLKPSHPTCSCSILSLNMNVVLQAAGLFILVKQGPIPIHPPCPYH